MSTQLHSTHPTTYHYPSYEPIKAMTLPSSSPSAPPSSSGRPPPVPAKKNHLRPSQSFNNYDASSRPAVPKRNDRGFGTLPKPPMPNPRMAQTKLSGSIPSLSNGEHYQEKPAHHVISTSSTNTSSILCSNRKEVIVTEGMSLPEFVQRFSSQLPLQIKVLKGYCGTSSRLTISTDDTYSIHFIKRARVVKIKDVHGQNYSVPLNSSVDFGVVYDKDGNSRGSDESLAGTKFSQVSDIMQLSLMPKVVCATKSWVGDDEKSSIAVNEVLIIKQIHKSRFKSKKTLKVFSLSSKSDKYLPEECHGEFSTQPYQNRMLISDMIEHMPNPFPCGAVIYLNPEIYQNPETSSKVHDIPETLLSRMITMQKCVTETSLISSAVFHTDPTTLDGFTEEDINKLIDIPLEGGLLQIEVAVVEIEETEKLYDDTRSIYEKYNPTRVKAMRDVASDRIYTAQSLFYSAVRQGCETFGVELDAPTSIYDSLKPDDYEGIDVGLSSSSGSSVGVGGDRAVRSSSGSCDGSPRVTKVKKAPIEVPQRTTTLPTDDNYSSTTIENIHSIDSTTHLRPVPPIPTRNRLDDSLLEGSESDSNYDDIEPLSENDLQGNSSPVVYPKYSIVNKKSKQQQQQQQQQNAEMFRVFEKRLGAVESALTKSSAESKTMVNKEMEQVRGAMDAMSKQMKALEDKLTILSHQSTSPPSLPPPATMTTNDSSSGESVKEKNKLYLMNMNTAHIQNLLEAMDLGQYREAFQREQVSGEILVELDEGVLQQELGISSKLHRIRLMKVISCQHSAYNIISGIDPYS